MSMNAIGIVCSDLQETIRFYQLLGLEFKEFGEGGHFEASLENGVRLMLDSVDLIKNINPQYEHRQGGCIVLCFEQKSPQQVDDVYEKLMAAGFESEKAPWDAFWGQRYASVVDPNKNQIDLFAAL